MQRTGQHWLVLTTLTHHRASAVAIVLALQSAPQFILLPISGLVADRMDRRQALFATQASMGLLALGLGLVTVAGVVRLEEVYVFALLLGCATALDGPVRHAFVAELVDEPDLPNAVALNSTSNNAARMIGPAVAGLLIAPLGVGWVFLINAASFAATLLSLAAVRVRGVAPRKRTGSYGAQLLEGVRYIGHQPDLRLAALMLFIMGTFGMNFPIYIATMCIRIFHDGPRGFGLLTSTMALGSVAGSLLAARRNASNLRQLTIGSLVFGLGCSLAGAAPSEWAFAGLLLALGAAAQTVTTGALTLAQLSTKSQLRGRVMAVIIALGVGGTPIGAPIVGWVADRFGPRCALGVGAAAGLCTAAVGIAALAARRRNRPALPAAVNG